MVPPLKGSLLSCILAAICATLCGAEPPLPNMLPDGSPAPGPVVVLTPRYGRDPYACFLTRIQSGIITVRMLGGEERQEVVSEIASVRFNPDHMPPPPRERDGFREPREHRGMREPFDGLPPLQDGRDGPPPPRDGRDGPPPRDQREGPPPPRDGRPRPTLKTRPLDGLMLRLKELQDREQNEKLTEQEVDELRRIREEGALFPPSTPRWWRVATARSAARQAFKVGKLDEHIDAMKRKLTEAGTLADANDAVIMLGHAYIQRDGPVFPEIIRKIEKDIGAIRNEQIRKDIQDHPPELVEVLREQKPQQNPPPK